MVHLGCMRQQPFELPANVAFGSKREIGPRNTDFRSSLNSKHSPTPRSRPKTCTKGDVGVFRPENCARSLFSVNAAARAAG